VGLSFTISAGPRQHSHSRVRDHILLSHIRDSPNLEGQAPVFMSLRSRVTQLYPRHWAPFLLPPTTCRTTVEVFEPASTGLNSLLQIVLLITSRHGPHRKHGFHCYNPTIPRPLLKNGLHNPVRLFLGHVCCCGNLFTEQLPGDRSGILNAFTSCYQARHIPSRDCCIETPIHATL
jgi:hypothetical protein